jgi:hypothetical protein
VERLLRSPWRDAVVLALIALGLIIYGANLRQAAGTAGFALIGAAVIRGFDNYGRTRDRVDAEKAARARDLSETRMLISIALASMAGELGAVRAGAAGTLTHALAYNSKLKTPTEAERLARDIVTASSSDQETGDHSRALAAKITRKLDEMKATE